MDIKKLFLIGILPQEYMQIQSAELEVASLIQFKQINEMKPHLTGKKQIIYYICDRFEKHLSKIVNKKVGIPSYMLLKLNDVDHNKRAIRYIRTVKDTITSELCRAFGKINPYETFRYGENKSSHISYNDDKYRPKKIYEWTISELNYYVLCNYLDRAINQEQTESTDNIMTQILMETLSRYQLDDLQTKCLETAVSQINEYIKIFKLDAFISENKENAKRINEAHNNIDYKDDIDETFLNRYDIKKRAGIHYGITNHGETCNIVAYLTMLKSSRHVKSALEEYNTNTKDNRDIDPTIALKELFDALEISTISNTGNGKTKIGKVEVDAAHSSPFMKFIYTLDGCIYYKDKNSKDFNNIRDIKTNTEISPADWENMKKSIYLVGRQLDISEVQQTFNTNIWNYKTNQSVKKALSSYQAAMQAKDILKKTPNDDSPSTRELLLQQLKRISAYRTIYEMTLINSHPLTKILGINQKALYYCFDNKENKCNHPIETNYEDYTNTDLIEYASRPQIIATTNLDMKLKESNNSIQDLIMGSDKQYDGKYSYANESIEIDCKKCNTKTKKVAGQTCTAHEVLHIHRQETDANKLLTPTYIERDGQFNVDSEPTIVKADKYIEFNGNLYVRRAGMVYYDDHYVCMYTGENGGEYFQSDDLVAEAKVPTNDKLFYRYELCSTYCGVGKETLPTYIQYINTLEITNVDDLYARCSDWLYDKVEW